MNKPTWIYKIAALVQVTAASLGVIVMLIAVFASRSEQHEWLLKSGPLVGLLFFVVAASSVIKSFSEK